MIDMLLKYLLLVVFFCAFTQEFKKNPTQDSFSLEVKETCVFAILCFAEITGCLYNLSFFVQYCFFK